MVFIQCSLTGTALSWYIRLNDTYKQDWSAFVQAFKKQFSSQKNAYYAQVEALTLVKKDNGKISHFALKVQQLVEKSWCNENASTINLKCKEIFTEGLPHKNLGDFANKRQVKHTSIVLEPSIPFHTLVKIVDAEHIANDKLRTHDPTLEVNSITKQLHHKTLKHNNLNTLCLHNLETLITNTNLHIKNIVHTVIEQIIPFLLVSRNNEMMKIKVTPTLDPNRHKNCLDNTFIHGLVTITLTEQTTNLQDPMIGIVVEVHHLIVIQTVILHHKIDIVPTPETDTNMTELLLLRNLTDQDMTTTDEIHVPIVHHTYLRIDRHIEKIHVIDIDHLHTLEIDNFHNTLRHIDPLHNH